MQHRASFGNQYKCNPDITITRSDVGQFSRTDQKHSYYFIFCPDMFKTYQSEKKLFEFWRDANREEL